MADKGIPTIVQVNYHFDRSRAEYDEAAMASAPGLAKTPGLRWKVWIVNEAEREAGGIYLFDDEAAARAFLNSEHVARVKSNPKIKNWTGKLFHVNEAPSAITRAPLARPATAGA